MHPSLVHIVTSGIERHVFLHSPTPTSPAASQFSETPTETRRLGEQGLDDPARFLRALLGPHPTLHEEMDEAGDEEEAIALFDQYVVSDDHQGPSDSKVRSILREEGGGNVFELRHWGDNEDSDAEDDLVVNMMDSPTG